MDCLWGARMLVAALNGVGRHETEPDSFRVHLGEPLAAVSTCRTEIEQAIERTQIFKQV